VINGLAWGVKPNRPRGDPKAQPVTGITQRILRAISKKRKLVEATGLRTYHCPPPFTHAKPKPNGWHPACCTAS